MEMFESMIGYARYYQRKFSFPLLKIRYNESLPVDTSGGNTLSIRGGEQVILVPDAIEDVL